MAKMHKVQLGKEVSDFFFIFVLLTTIDYFGVLILNFFMKIEIAYIEKFYLTPMPLRVVKNLTPMSVCDIIALDLMDRI